MARSRDELEQDRADLLAALGEAERLPIRADDLIAAAAGTTVQDYPDATWDARLRAGLADLRYLARHGQLAVQAPPQVCAWEYVDHVGSDLDQRAVHREDLHDVRRQLSEWEPADG